MADLTADLTVIAYGLEHPAIEALAVRLASLPSTGWTSLCHRCAEVEKLHLPLTMEMVRRFEFGVAFTLLRHIDIMVTRVPWREQRFLPHEISQSIIAGVSAYMDSTARAGVSAYLRVHTSSAFARAYEMELLRGACNAEKAERGGDM